MDSHHFPSAESLSADLDHIHGRRYPANKHFGVSGSIKIYIYIYILLCIYPHDVVCAKEMNLNCLSYNHCTFHCDDNKNDYNEYSDSNEPMNSNDNNNNESVME